MIKNYVLAIFTIDGHARIMPVTQDSIAERVRSLIAAHGMDQQEAAARLGMDPSALSRALGGTRHFKALELATLAELFDVSPGYLLGEPQRSLPVAMAARRNADNPPALEAATRRAKFFIELQQQLGDPMTSTHPIELPNLWGSAWRQGETLADAVRAQVRLPVPLPSDVIGLAAAIESALGYDVSLEALGHGVDGLSVACGNLHLAMVSTSVAPARQRWTLAHEVGHLVAGDTQELHVDASVWDSGSTVERRANAFAAAFLMPVSQLRERLAGAQEPSEELVASLMDHFNVSLQALAYRLHNVGIMNAAGRDRVLNMQPLLSLIRAQQVRPGATRWYPTQLGEAAIRAYQGGQLGVRWLAAFLEVDAEELLAQLQPNEDEGRAMAQSDTTVSS